MAYPKRLIPDTIRTSGFAAVLAAYSAVGTALTAPARIVRFLNTTNEDVYFSLDGVNAHFMVPSNTFLLLDVTTNKVRDDGYFISEGTVFYVARVGAAPTSGSVFIEVLHG